MPGPDAQTATPGLALTCCVALGELLAFSDPELSALYKKPEAWGFQANVTGSPPYLWGQTPGRAGG